MVAPAQGRLSEPLRNGDLSWDDFLSDDDAFRAVACDPDDAINILFSSGTTGEPKAIPFTHLTPIKCAADGCLHQDIRDGDVVGWPTSLGWMMGPWLIYASLINGATIALYDGIPHVQAILRVRAGCESERPGGGAHSGRGLAGPEAAWKGLDWSSVRVFTSTGECSNPGRHALSDLPGGIPARGGVLRRKPRSGAPTSRETVVQTSVASAFSTAALGMSLTILDRRGVESDQGEIFIVSTFDRSLHAPLEPGPPPGVLRRNAPGAGRGPRCGVMEIGWSGSANGYYRAQGRMDDTMNLGGIKVGSAEIERVPETGFRESARRRR